MDASLLPGYPQGGAQETNALKASELSIHGWFLVWILTFLSFFLLKDPTFGISSWSIDLASGAVDANLFSSEPTVRLSETTDGLSRGNDNEQQQ